MPCLPIAAPKRVAKCRREKMSLKEWTALIVMRNIIPSYGIDRIGAAAFVRDRHWGVPPRRICAAPRDCPSDRIEPNRETEYRLDDIFLTR
jgi:hypothetical protein